MGPGFDSLRGHHCKFERLSSISRKAFIVYFLIFYEISFVVFRIQHIPLTFWMKQCSKRYGLGCSNAESTDNRMPWIKEPCIYPRLWEDWKSSFPVTIFLRLHAIALSFAFIPWIAKLSQLPACYPLWLYLSATEILSYDNLRHSSGDRKSFYLLFIYSRIIYGVRYQSCLSLAVCHYSIA